MSQLESHFLPTKLTNSTIAILMSLKDGPKSKNDLALTFREIGDRRRYA